MDAHSVALPLARALLVGLGVPPCALGDVEQDALPGALELVQQVPFSLARSERERTSQKVQGCAIYLEALVFEERVGHRCMPCRDQAEYWTT